MKPGSVGVVWVPPQVKEPIVANLIGKHSIGMGKHDVEDYRDARLVTGTHHSLEPRRAPETLFRGEVEDVHVAPLARLRHTADRHEFNRVHPQALEIGDAVGDAVEGSGKLGNVDLVEHQVGESGDLEAAVRQLVLSGVGAHAQDRENAGVGLVRARIAEVQTPGLAAVRRRANYFESVQVHVRREIDEAADPEVLGQVAPSGIGITRPDGRLPEVDHLGGHRRVELLQPTMPFS